MPRITKNILLSVYSIFFVLPMILVWILIKEVDPQIPYDFFFMSIVFGFGTLAIRAFYKFRNKQSDGMSIPFSNFMGGMTKGIANFVVWGQLLGGLFFCISAITIFLLTVFEKGNF